MDVVTLALAKKGAKTYTDSKLGAITGDFNYLGSVATIEDLPATANAGDEYTVGNLGPYVYNGTTWVAATTKGDTGAQGPQGETGPQGPAGKDGAIQYTAGTGLEITSANVINSKIVDNVTSIVTTEALSAHQGKLLNDRIDNLETMGRYLSLWNCSTGLPVTNPTSLPYEYKAGDYFRISAVSTTTNYMPNGDSYTGVASTTTTSEEVYVGDVWFYDGTTWSLQVNHEGGTVEDVQVNGTSILSGGVANIPKADGSTFGVFKTSSSTATYITGAGALAASEKTYSDYASLGSGCFVGKGTLENVLTNETVRPDAAQSLTTAQKTQARTNINAITMEEYDSTATPEDNVLYYVIED